MKVKIKRGAADLYVAYTVHTDRSYVNDSYKAMLKQIENQWIEIETKYIFLNQYNTVPIPKVSKDGLRIEERYIEKIDFEGDDRLIKVLQALKNGDLKCHSVKYDEGLIIDYHTKDIRFAPTGPETSLESVGL